MNDPHSPEDLTGEERQLLTTWRAGSDSESSIEVADPSTQEEILMQTRHRARGLLRRTLYRDIGELAALLLVIGTFGWMAYSAPGWTAEIALAAAVPLLLYPLLRLFGERRRHRSLDLSGSVKQSLEKELERVEGQMVLLSSVRDWYLRPITAAGLLVMAGLGASYPPGGEWPLRLLCAAAAVAATSLIMWPVNRAIARMNGVSVERQFEPLRGELRAALAELEG